MCVHARVYSLSLLSLSSRSLTQEVAAGGFRRVFGALRRGGQPQRSTSVRAKVVGVVGVYLDAQHVHYRSDTCSPPPPPRRKAPKTRRKPPAAASCVKLRELKLKRESEQTRACTRKLGRPTPALEHPTDDKFCWSGGGNSHQVVEAELHLLHVDDLLQPPVAAQRAALAAGWRADGAAVGRSAGHLAFLPAGDDGAA